MYDFPNVKLVRALAGLVADTVDALDYLVAATLLPITLSGVSVV